MKRKAVFGLVLSAMFLAVAAAYGFRAIEVVGDLSHESGKLGAYRALIIGIDDYKDPRIPDLKTAVNDARVMGEVLQKKYGFQVELMLNSEATKAAMYQALRRLAGSAKPEDSLLIYYAGHGDLDRQYNDGWWIPVDAKAGDPVSYLDNVQVQKAMGNTKARHVLLISDSCYSGTLFGRGRALPSVITDKYYLGLYNEKSRWGMTSGNKTPVSDEGAEGHSIFAYQLLKELKKNEKPYMSTQELYTRIAPIVGNNSEQTPLCSPIRNTGDQGGEFIFVASSGATVSVPVPSRKTTLSVTANVTGAKVLVDGRYVGETPLKDAAVAAGARRLHVEASGYDAYERTIDVEQGRAVSLWVDLSRSGPRKARLYVETTPKEARVRILNIGPVFSQGMELDPGRYQVEVSAEGHEKENRWVELSSGEDETLHIRLAPVVQATTGEKLTNSLGMEFVYIPPGSFLMGSPTTEADRRDDEKQHRLTLSKGYYMQSKEVTVGQWRRFARESGYRTEAETGDGAYIYEGGKWAKKAGTYWDNPAFSQRDDYPVTCVSWNDAQEFIRWLNGKGEKTYRLPTEAEWEYGARAGTDTPFSFGRCLSTDQANYNGNYPYSGCSKGQYRQAPVAVGSFSPNGWGLYDMHGNVWEWCQDWKADYFSGSVTDPTGPDSGSYRVNRGGSWSSRARNCRSADRNRSAPGYRNNNLGFRLAFSSGQ